MTRRILSQFAVLLALLPVYARAQDHSAAQAAVLSRMQGITAAWGTMDETKIKPFYTADPNVVIFDLSPLEYHGAQAYIAGSQREFADFSSLSLTIRGDAQVHAVTADSAWATATVDIATVSKAGKKDSMAARWTSIWQKTGGNWIIVHEHWSLPLPPTP